MDIEKILKESAKDVLTDETLKLMKEAFDAEVERRVSERVQLEIEDIDKKSADDLKDLVESIDKEHAKKYQSLLEAVDTDHIAKMNNLVKEMDKSYTSRLQLVKEHYEDKQQKEMVQFKNTLLEAIDQHIDNILDEKIPADIFHKAAKSYVEKQKPVQEAKKPSLLESLTKGFSSEKKIFVESRLKNLDETQIQKHFNHVANLFEKNALDKKKVIAESAIRQSIDSQVHATENNAEVSVKNEISPLIQSYIVKFTSA